MNALDRHYPEEFGAYGPGLRRRRPRPHWQCVWPRDKRQTGARSWDRFKDILTGKGPNMWLRERGSDGPHRPLWSEWLEFGNLGYRDSTDELPPLFDFPDHVYDFRSRKYRRRGPTLWSDAKWPSRPNLDAEGPHYIRNASGRHWSRTANHSNELNRWRHHSCVPQWNWEHPPPQWVINKNHGVGI